jgi:hypothetical protein
MRFDKYIETIDEKTIDEAYETWAEKFGIHSTTFGSFLQSLQEDVLEFELEMRRRGRHPNMSQIRRLLGQLAQANKEVRRILVNVAKVEGI